ncbi:MAG: hypothetical protein ABW133_06120 [Polyangiaceae bacterium]
MSISKKIGFGLAVIVSAFIVNCSDSEGSNDNGIKCDSAKSKCSADPTPSAQDISTCNKYLGDAKCGTTYATALACLANNQVCGSDNKTDEEATSAKCKSQIQAVEDCDPSIRDGGIK